jgi:hypothetical protein
VIGLINYTEKRGLVIGLNSAQGNHYNGYSDTQLE